MSTTQAALQEALTNARDIIATDRQAFVDCHQVRNDELIHEAGALGLVLVGEGAWIAPEDAEPLHDYDRALAKIDAALSAAEAAPPEPVAYLARSRYGSQCHFGMKAAADAWAGDGGEVFEIPLRHLGLVSPSLAQPAPIAAQADEFLPLLLRDLCRELGVSVPEAAAALRTVGLGEVSQGTAVTPAMARVLRDKFDGKALAAQAGPALVPLTDEQIDKLMREIGRKIEGRILVPGVPMHGDWPVYYRAKVRAAIAIAAQAPASTRPADASISGWGMDKSSAWSAAAPQAPAEPAAQAVEQDAARYRWLRDKAPGEIVFDRHNDDSHFMLIVPFDGEPVHNDTHSGMKLDEAIDAAMAATPAAREAGTPKGNTP